MIDETEPGGSSAQRYASETLCSDLSRGLHAAAQPLTILRASLGNWQIDQMSRGELRELAANSAMEVERVCNFFSCLQQLVISKGAKPRLSATPIQPLLTDLADGVNLLFEKDRMFLRSVVPDNCPPVLINKVRTIQALSTVLLIAHGVSRAQDTVELIVLSSTSNMVRLVVRNQELHLDVLSVEANLSMALAEANIRSQMANFSLSLQPFNVQIEFQKAPTLHYC